jgi:DNA-binding IscR family transcriptional regulator
MQIGSKFPVAVHVLLLVEVFGESRKVTSDFIASSVNTNPVVIRKIMGLLRDAGLIEIAAGTGGIRLTRPPAELSLFDIYRATDAVKDGKLFRMHEDAAKACPVGGNIALLLEPHFDVAQAAMEAELGATSLGSLLAELDGLRRKGKRQASRKP